MNRIIIACIVVSGIQLLVDNDWPLLSELAAVLLLFGGIFSLLFRGKMVKHGASILLALVLGPYLLAILFAYLRSSLAILSQSPLFIPVIIGMIAAAYFYVRARILSGKKIHAQQITPNERQPIFPLHRPQKGDEEE